MDKRSYYRSDYFSGKIQQDTKQNKKTNSIPCYTLISGFNFFQLFLIAHENKPFSNRLLGQQTTAKYTHDDASDKLFDLNDLINNQSIANHKDLIKNLILDHISFNNQQENDSDENNNQQENESDENNNQQENHSDENNNNIIYTKEDKFYDRRNFIANIEKCQDSIAFDRKIEFIKLEESNLSDQITKKLMDSDIDCNPFLFYTFDECILSNFDFPVKVLIQRDIFKYINDSKKKSAILDKIANRKKMNPEYTEDDKRANLNKIIAEKKNCYYYLSFIIGSKNGVPVLIIFDDNKMIKIYDNKSEPIEGDDDLTNSIDQIYILYYSKNGFDNINQLKNSSSIRKKLMHSQISETDDILKNFIQYKFQNSWNKKFNFIELIKESVIYPAFFGFCSGLNLEISFYGTVALSTDRTSESSIIGNFEVEKQQKIRMFIQTYGTFTTFVMTLPKFLEAIKSQDFENANILIKFLFGTIPAHNEIFFDLYVQFLLKIIKSDDFTKNRNFKKDLKQYLLMTVSNKENLGFEPINFQTQTFSKLFSLSQRQGESSNIIMAVDMLDRILPSDDQNSSGDNYFKKLFEATVELVIDEADKDTDKTHFNYIPKFNKNKTYTDFLDKAFTYPEIHL